MRKFLIFIVLVFMLILGCFCVFKGTTNIVTIYNLEEVSNKQKVVDDEIAKIKSLQSKDLKVKQDKLKKSMKEYEEAKDTYEDLLVTASEEEKEEAVMGEFYDIEFLWTKLGTYSTKLGVDVTMTISKAGSVQTNNDSYQLCNFDFKVTGTYINVADYVYAIEDDSDLGFGINSFKLLPDGDKLTATFVLEQIPVSTATLSDLATSEGVTMNDESEEESSSNTTSDTTSNTTNNTTNSSSNSTNTNSNNSNNTSNSNNTNNTNSKNTTNTTN